MGKKNKQKPQAISLEEFEKQQAAKKTEGNQRSAEAASFEAILGEKLKPQQKQKKKQSDDDLPGMSGK